MTIFDHVEEVMANLMCVFYGGITMQDMNAMSIDELMDWHSRAKVRVDGS